jgi:hypothetical protein
MHAIMHGACLIRRYSATRPHRDLLLWIAILQPNSTAYFARDVTKSSAAKTDFVFDDAREDARQRSGFNPVGLNDKKRPKRRPLKLSKFRFVER